MDTHVKERLTGAVILVVLVVLVVPELLRGPKVTTPVGAPPSAGEGTPVRSYRVDLTGRGGAVERLTPPEAAGEPAGSSQPAAAPGAAPAPGTSSPSAAVAAGPPSAPQTPPPAPPVAPAAPSRPATAATASAGAAQAAPAPSPAPPVTLPAAPSAVPAAPPAAAVPAAKPVVPGSAAAQTAASPPSVAATGGAWAIQVGSFSSRDNAERLVKQLESKGFKAYVSKTGTGAKQMYRVRVGPVPSRAAVDALAQKLRAAGRAGTVVAPGA